MDIGRTGLVVALSAALLSGCYSWTEIKPTELPKLNGGAVATGTIVSGTNRGHVIAVSVGHVEGPDGRLQEVNGEFDARVVRQSGEQVVFEHPVRSELSATTLTVQGANRATTPFELEDVRQVEVSQYDPAKSTLIGVGLAVGGGLLLGAMLTQSSSE